jgi:hypothetical protein
MPPNKALMAYLPKASIDMLLPAPVLPNTQKGRDLEEFKTAILTRREEARDALAFAEDGPDV